MKLLFGITFLAAMANADTLLAYEGFNYTTGSSLNGQNGGTGWSGAWGTPGGLDATIAASSLTSGGLTVSGGALSTAGSQPANQGSSVATWTRTLSTAEGADNTTAYFSFLLRPDAGSGFYGGINFGGVFIGVSGNQTFYGLEGPGNNISLSTVPVVTGQTVLLVLRADFKAGNDVLSLYINPTAGGAEPGTANVMETGFDLGTVNSVTVNNYGGFTTDEIRIGTSFASVTPSSAVPEPTYGIAVALVGAVMFGLRRRTASI